jgi:hypothetical protein
MSNITDRLRALVGSPPASGVTPRLTRYVSYLALALAACTSSEANPVADNASLIVHENQNNDSVFFFKYGMNQPGDTQFLRFDLTTRNHWANNPGSHFAVVLQGAWLLDTPGIRGVGIALGNMGSCIGLAAENFNNPTSSLFPGTCVAVPFLDNETYHFELTATSTLLTYTVTVAGVAYSNSVVIDTTAFGPQRSWAAAVVGNPNNSTIEIRNLAWGWQ